MVTKVSMSARESSRVYFGDTGEYALSTCCGLVCVFMLACLPTPACICVH